MGLMTGPPVFVFLPPFLLLAVTWVQLYLAENHHIIRRALLLIFLGFASWNAKSTVDISGKKKSGIVFSGIIVHMVYG